MAIWNKDAKGNEVHEGDFVEFALGAIYTEEARSVLNGRSAFVKKLSPGMPWTAHLHRLDPVAKEFLAGVAGAARIPVNALRIRD